MMLSSRCARSRRAVSAVGPANAAIARYEGVLSGIPNPDILLSPLTSREAILSSKIEETQVMLGEIVEFKAQGHLLDESTPKSPMHVKS